SSIKNEYARERSKLKIVQAGRNDVRAPDLRSFRGGANPVLATQHHLKSGSTESGGEANIRVWSRGHAAGGGPHCDDSLSIQNQKGPRQWEPRQPHCRG